MKKMFVSFLFLTRGSLLFAQVNPSHLKIIVNSDNTVSPPYNDTFHTYSDITPGLTGSGIQLFDISMDSTAKISIGPIPIFYSKFRWEGGISEIGIDSGMAMSTGWVINTNNDPLLYHPIPGSSSGIPWPAKYNAGANYPGGYSAVGFGGAYATRWDQFPDLVTLNHGDSIAEAVILEFDFIPDSNHIALDYVFASEEYPNMDNPAYPSTVCDTPNDVMGIFLSGPGITGEQNIALIPGTDIPVGVNTITPPGWNCSGRPDYSQYYVDNTGGQNVIYNGFTTVLTAQARVIPGATYHLKIGVADGARHPEAFDTLTGWADPLLGFYDSGIFLKFGSFRSYHAEDTTNGINNSIIVGAAEISVSPNPFSEDFQLYAKTSNNQSYQMQLTDALGRTILTQKGTIAALNSQLEQSGLDQLPQGSYFLKLWINNHSQHSTTFKLIKTQ